MAISEILNSNPYYSDFDPNKNIIQVLFKPGFAVQTRELIELQTIIQNQVSNFADHVFKNGARVLGGMVTEKVVSFVKVSSQFNGLDITTKDWLGKTFQEYDDGNLTGISAKLMAVEHKDNSVYLYFEYDETVDAIGFKAGNTLYIKDSSEGCLIDSNLNDYSGKALFVGVDEGVYYIEGRFVKIESQRILASKYNTTPTGLVGFEYRENILTVEDDFNLRDRAQGSPNYNAPGADRFTMECGLRFYDESEEKPGNFISILEYENGEIKSHVQKTDYSELAKEFARRTYDESGDYTVTPFDIFVKDHVGVRANKITHGGGLLSHQAYAVTAKPHGLSLDDICVVSGVTGDDAALYNGSFKVDEVVSDTEFKYSISGVPQNDATGESIIIQRDDQFTVEMGAGKAYVKGYEIEKISYENITVPKARQTAVIDNYATSVLYGNYLVVKDISGIFDDTKLVTLNLFASNERIGSAKLRNISLHEGIPGTPAAKYKIYLYDFSFNENYGISDVTKLTHNTSTAFVDDQSITKSQKINYIETGIHSEDNLPILSEDGITVFGESIKELIDYNVTALSQTDANTLIFRVPEEKVKTLAPANKSDTSFITKRKMEGLVTGTSTVSFNLEENQYFVGPISQEFANTEIAYRNYHFINKNTGNIINPVALELTDSGQEVIATFSGAGYVVQLLASVQNTKAKEKSKALIETEVDIPYTSINTSYTLPHTDIFEVSSIKHNGIEYLDSFDIDNGQRDNFYDFGSITLNKTVDLDDGDIITVKLKYFEHTGEGYFSVDSYTGISYDDIPSYKSNQGEIYNLSDVLDFRPTRKNTTVHEGNAIPIPNSLITSDFEFYLPRRDRVVLDRFGEFKVIQGEPSINPVYPEVPDTSMQLYDLDVPAYTGNPTKDTTTRFIENRRYTMRDIGRIDRRVDRLEYYTSLSLLEVDAKQNNVVDENGETRFKNGFLVDNFRGHNVGDVQHPDYSCSIDFEKHELRPSFDSENIKMEYSAASSSSVNQVGSEESGYLFTLPYENKLHITHPNATKAESVNPYLVVRKEGTLRCNPSSDDWVDDKRKPDLKVNLAGDDNAWEFMAQAINAGAKAAGFGTRWNDWQTTWRGVSRSISRRRRGSTSNAGRTITTITTTRQQRDGEQDIIRFGTASTSIGDKIVDINLKRFMRSIQIKLSGTSMRPNTDLHVFVDDVKVNSNTAPGTGFAALREGVIRTNEFGEVNATLTIPEGKFRTGERTITLIDDTNNIKSNATTFAKYVFAASGLITTKQDTIVSTRQPFVTTQQIEEKRVVRRRSVFTIPSAPERDNSDGRDRGDPRGDPFAQTIFVNSESNPYGLFLSSVGFFFRKKPSTNHPIEVHIRPVVNGYPHSSKIIPLSVSTLKPSQVNIPEKTDDVLEIRKAETVFNFESPIYLEAGQEYAIVLISDSSEYECYISEMGKPILGTNRIASQQPSLGSLFKSQNARTWTASQTEDMMMNVYRCAFNTSVQSDIVYKAGSNLPHEFDLMMYNAEILDFDDATGVRHEYKIKDKLSKELNEDWKFLNEKTNTDFETRKLVETADDLLIKTSISTTRDDIAPLIDASRNSVIAVRNYINNFGLSRKGFVINNGGSGYTEAQITVDGGVNASIKPVIDNGAIIDLTVENQGNSYYDIPTVTVTGDGSDAEIVFTENELTGIKGNCEAKYITKKVTLNEDWESNYVKVILDAYKPKGTDIKVYYKAIASEDSLPFDDLPWVEMKRNTDNPLISNEEDEFLEHTYVPVNNSLAYTRNGVKYDRVKTSVIKIVMISDNTIVIPKVKDLRCIWAAP